MRILLFLMVVTLSSSVSAESALDLSNELKSEIGVLEGSLLAIDSVLTQMQATQQMLLKKNEAEQIVLQKRIDYLENKKSELEADRISLEKQLSLLDASEGSLTDLINNYERGEKILEGQIRLWRGIAIGGGVAVVAIVTYIIIKGVTP